MAKYYPSFGWIPTPEERRRIQKILDEYNPEWDEEQDEQEDATAEDVEAEDVNVNEQQD